MCFLIFLRSLEEDFVSWREQFWPAVCEHFGVEPTGEESRYFLLTSLYSSLYSLLPAKCTVLVDQESHVHAFFFFFSSPHSIRQYELKIHEDLNMNKIYTGELGRLKSFENQKPYVMRHHSTCVRFCGVSCAVTGQRLQICDELHHVQRARTWVT